MLESVNVKWQIQDNVTIKLLALCWEHLLVYHQLLLCRKSTATAPTIIMKNA